MADAAAPIDVKAQVNREHGEILNAPVVAAGPMVGRCGVCGRAARTLTPYETIDGVTRFKGECCKW